MAIENPNLGPATGLSYIDPLEIRTRLTFFKTHLIASLNLGRAHPRRQIYCAKGVSAGSDYVEGIDIPNLMAMIEVSHIDLLKVDIESSEAEVFETNPAAWLPLVRNIAIELHGPTCTKIFRSALSNYSFIEKHSGDVTFCLEMQLNDSTILHSGRAG